MNHTKTWQHCPRCDYTEIEGTYTVDQAGARSAFGWGFLVGGLATVLGTALPVLLAGWIR